jgi:malate dehydrogenase (quinone)
MKKKYDVVLIGAGVMSATLGMLIKKLMPHKSVAIYEKLDIIAAESSDAWNNAGTGHSAFCELNYTPEEADGNVNISKALNIASQFEETKQFWSYLIEKGILENKEEFIQQTPHLAFVWGGDNVYFLRKRFEEMTRHALFDDMEYSENKSTLQLWMPLIMAGRKAKTPVAATKVEKGTDVNFGTLTRKMISYLDEKEENVDVFLEHEIIDLKRHDEYAWQIDIEDTKGKHVHHIWADFVFIGAGGAALPLLEKSDIEEAEGYGGFPISGQWLRCTNETIINQHHTKVYGKASVGAPPMSVPHLDTRMIDGKRELLFGPFAGFSTKFLKKGSYLDLPKSIDANNILPMIQAGIHNLPLTKYLIDQVRLKHEDRVEALKEYFPAAKAEDWELVVAGQRVQVIKKDEEEGGVLEFGTEIISSADGSIAALLGASPGASTAVSIMLNVMKKCFGSEFKNEQVSKKLKEMIPSYGKSLITNTQLLNKVRNKSNEVLDLK